MLGAVGGDIVGSRFEGEPAPRPGFELFHRHCQLTDDTVCTIAVAEAAFGLVGNAVDQITSRLTPDLLHVIETFRDRVSPA